MMSSGTPAEEPSSMWSTGWVSSLPPDNVTKLPGTVSGSEFTSSSNVTSSNSTAALDGNSSSVWTKNSSQEVADLEALNLSMTKALMPTIVYLVVLMVVGVVGNSVVFMVYYRRFKPSATRTYVLAMSVCDLLANVLSLPSEIIDIRYSFTFDLPYLCKTVRGFNSFLTVTSAFVLVAVARDRFTKICQPLSKQLPLKRIYINVLICGIASLALSVVFGALNGSKTIPTGVGNATGITCSVSDVFLDTLFPLVYNLIMALTFVSCVVIMVVSYVRIAVELWRHKKKQARMSGAGPITKASAAKGADPAVVEDTSSGPLRGPQHSDTKSSSSAELLPLKSAHSREKIQTTKTAPTDTSPASGSGNQVLLSIKNSNYEGPSSSVEDSDEGCFSGCSMETTSTSVDLSKSGQVQNGQEARGDSHPSSFQTPTSDASGSTSAISPEDCVTPSHDSPTMTSNAPGINDHEVSRTPDKTSSDHDVQPAADSASSPQRGFKDRSSSLLQRLLTSRRRRHDNKSQTAKSTRSTSRSPTGKKSSTVKAIPSSTTLMMFVLTATFIVNYLPHLVIICMRAMFDTFGQGLEGALLNLYNVGLRSYFMNCAVNSIVYGFCSARFRHECRQLFARK